jgi:hypothetical protein
MHFSDEAVPRASAIAAAPPDEDVLEIRARAADAILGPAHFKRAEAATGRASALLERPLAYGRYAALAACLFGFAWMGQSYFSSPARTVAQQESVENARAAHAAQKITEEIRAFKGDVEAIHAAQSPSAKDAAALGGMNPHLDAANTATTAAVAEAAGKVEHLQRESAAMRSKVIERFDRIGDKIAALLAAAPVADRSASAAPVVRKRAQGGHDAFDPSQNPTAPGAPRSLGTIASAASPNNSPAENAYGGRTN